MVASSKHAGAQKHIHATSPPNVKARSLQVSIIGHEAAAELQSGQEQSIDECWAEAPIKIARMTLTIKLDGNWNSFQLANSAPPLSVTDSAIAPSARIHLKLQYSEHFPGRD